MTIRPLLAALPRRLNEAFWERRNQTAALLALIASAVAQIAAWVFLPEWVQSSYTVFQVAVLMPLAVFLGAAATPKRGSAIEQLMSQPKASDAPFLMAAAAHLYSHCEDRRAARVAIRELVKELRDLRTEQRYLPDITAAVKSHCVWAVCGRKTDDAAESFWEANACSHGKGNTIERIFIPPRNDEEERSLETAIQRHLAGGMTVRAFGPRWKGSDVLFNWKLPEGFGMTLLGRRRESADQPPELTRVLIHWGYIGDKVPHEGVILTSPAWTAHFWELYEQMALKAQPTAAANVTEFFARHRNYVLQRAALSSPG